MIQTHLFVPAAVSLSVVRLFFNQLRLCVLLPVGLIRITSKFQKCWTEEC